MAEGTLLHAIRRSSAGESAWQSVTARYLLAVAAVLVAAVMRSWLADAFGHMPPFIAFYPAVLVVAIVAGAGPGILAIALCALLADYLWIPPVRTYALPTTADWIAVGVFVGMSLVLCALAERLRRARLAEAAARRQMELASVSMASIRDGVIVTDLEGRVTFLNDAAESLLGRRRADVESLSLASVLKVVETDGREPVGDLISAVLRSGSPGCVADEVTLLTQDGREPTIELSGAPVRAEDGGIRGVVLTFRDCTGRSRAEKEVKRLYEAVHAEKERLSLVLSNISDEVYFTDTEGRYLFANAAALREFGHASVEGVEVKKVISHMIVLRADGSPRPMDEAPPLRALNGEVIRDEEQIVRTPRTGELRHRQVSSAPVRDASGKIIGSVSVVRDVTERKRVEAALREADHRKNVFLATLSHELRNPLAPIRTAALLLDSPQASQADLKRCQSIISRQVAHMASLLDDLLDVSRLTRGELTLKKAYVPLRQLLDAAVETAQPLIDAKRHRLRVEVPPEPLTLEVDPVRLTQVVSNLLTNAAKYTSSGGEIALECRLEAETLLILVRDTGIGMSPEMYSEIFKMFIQIEPATERAEGGLGIGLALVKALVELHGGRITVHSAGRDRGSTFTVILPRSVIAAEPSRPLPASASESAHERSPRRVLVADDNADGADVLATLLQLSGHEVHVARDGAEAFELAARLRPDVALLDIGMPRLSGYEVAARIRNEAWGGPMILIAVTGWGQEEDKRKAEAAGFDHHLTKPMDPAELESVLASRPSARA